MTVSGAGFDKPAVETTLPWTYVFGTPCGVIFGLSSLTRGPKSLGSPADANVSLCYPPSEALQLVTILVACILFVHHMSPSENCHIQAHVAFTARSQSAIAEVQEISTRSQPFHDRVLLSIPW